MVYNTREIRKGAGCLRFHSKMIEWRYSCYNWRYNFLLVIVVPVHGTNTGRPGNYSLEFPGLPVLESFLSISHKLYFCFWRDFIGANLAFKTGLKIDASGLNRLEIRFPYDLDL